MDPRVAIVTYSGRTPCCRIERPHPDRQIALLATVYRRKRFRDPFLHQQVRVDRYSFFRLDCLLAADLVVLLRRRGARPRRARRNHMGQFALCFSRSFNPWPVFGILVGRHTPAADNLISPDSCRHPADGFGADESIFLLTSPLATASAIAGPYRAFILVSRLVFILAASIPAKARSRREVIVFDRVESRPPAAQEAAARRLRTPMPRL
jgi:hypothetical protein